MVICCFEDFSEIAGKIIPPLRKMNWKDLSYYFTNISTFLLGIITLIPLFGSLFKGGRAVWYKRLKTKGYIFITLSLVAVCIQLYSSYCNREYDKIEKSEEGKKDSLTKIELSKQAIYFAKENKIALDSNEKRIILNFGEAIGRYKLRYDSATKEIVKIVKDSARIQVIPTVSVCPYQNGFRIDSTTKKYHYLTVTLCVSAATAKDINLRIYGISLLSNGQLQFHNFNYIDFQVKSLSPIGVSHEVGCVIENNDKLTDVMIYIIGNFKTQKDVVFPLEQLKGMEMKTKLWGTPKPDLYNLIENEFKRNKIL